MGHHFGHHTRIICRHRKQTGLGWKATCSCGWERPNGRRLFQSYKLAEEEERFHHVVDSIDDVLAGEELLGEQELQQ